MNAAFAAAFAARGLQRGGQRTLLAAACVAFGVMSLVALQLLSSMVSAAIALEPRQVLGGDAELSRGDGTLGPDAVEALERMKARGEVAAYTLVAPGRPGLLKRRGSGRAEAVGRALGVDPASYPLVGELRVRGAGAGLGALVDAPGAVVVSRDLADSMGLGAGDEVTFAGDLVTPPTRLEVAGVAEMTPDRQGGTIYYGPATARALGQEPRLALVVWGAAPPPAEALAAAGWAATGPDEVLERRKRVSGLFGFMLQGAGVLGLLLAGIGVSNTMQVLLARRRTEIATLKTLGYGRHHLVALFGLEAAMLGVAGSAAGAAAGLALSAWLRVLLGRTGPIMLEQAFDPAVVLGGSLAGVATAVVFGLHAIVRASAVRPSVLLRDLPTPFAWKEAAALYAALGLLFSALASAVLGSPLGGAAVVAGGFAGLGVLAAVLGLGLFAAVATPLPLPGVVAMARSGLRRQPARALVALVALFCGVFTIGFAGATLSSAADRFASRALPGDGLNVAVYSRWGDRDLVAGALAGEEITGAERAVTAPVGAAFSAGRRLDGVGSVTGAGADPGAGVRIVEGAWTGEPGEALAPERLRREPAGPRVGDPAELVSPAGARERVRLVGFYEARPPSPLVPRAAGLIVDEATAARLGGDAAATSFVAAVEESRQSAAADALGRALPDAMVLTRRDVNSAIQGTLENLFAFVIAVAGLALVAGAVLIANSVGLAMVERRRETGILKAIGYSSARVLGGIAVEYGLLGLISGVAGMGAVALAFAAIDRMQPEARLSLDPLQAVAMVAVATGIALASAVAVAWRPVHARPLEVLRQE